MKDIKLLMDEVGKRADLTVQCDKALADLPEEERVWTADIEPGTTVLGLLGDGLGKLSALDWVYTDGKILITTKEIAQERLAQAARDKEEKEALAVPAKPPAKPGETPGEPRAEEPVAETPSTDTGDTAASSAETDT